MYEYLLIIFTLIMSFNVAGVVGPSLRLDQSVIDDPAGNYINYGEHRDKCFGSLIQCPDGFTMAFWFKLGSYSGSAHYYISSGGQTKHSHGITVGAKPGKLFVGFRTPQMIWNGAEYAMSTDIATGRN